MRERMRGGAVGVRTTNAVSGLLVGVTIACSTLSASGCAVDDDAVHRWETTEHGPDKLYAVLVHDKYPFALRSEAAMSLIRMKPRQGQRVGLENLVRGLESLTDEGRRKLVADITPKIIENMRQPAPPKNPDGTIPPDTTIPYKDAAFALISHEPPLVADDHDKQAFVTALLQWVQTDFEARIDYSGQQYGLEQIMRHPAFGAPSVKTLPSLIREESLKNDRVSALVADIGDDDAKKRTAEALVTLAKKIDSNEWINRQKPLVDDANKRAKLNVTPEQLTEQLKKYQEQELEKVFANMKRVGGRPVVDYAIAYAGDKGKSEAMRTRALAAIENRVEKGNSGDIEKIFDIARDDTNPDKVRGLALQRLGELPKEQVVAKMYTLFEGKKWQVRLDAARLVLKTISTKELPEFMRRLPQSDRQKIGLSEPIAYGALINAMDPAGGPKPRDVLQGYMSSGALGPKLTALGSFYGGKKSERNLVVSHENDNQPVPKCEAADNCGWSCDVSKPGTQEKETKQIQTVGDFVKFCIAPSMDGS